MPIDEKGRLKQSIIKNVEEKCGTTLTPEQYKELSRVLGEELAKWKIGKE